MTLSNRRKFSFCFTIVCILTVAFMVGFWFHKYIVEDRDIGVVDYIPLEEANEIMFPAVSLCLESPFLIQQLSEISSNITDETYYDFLAGNIHDDLHSIIDYANVTVDLGQYFRTTNIQWLNDTFDYKVDGSTYHLEVFSGFHHETFLKCFMIKYEGTDQRKIKHIKFIYDKKRLLEDWSKGHWWDFRCHIVVHYEGQFYLANEFNEFNSFYLDEQIDTKIRINKFEIIKRRNSRRTKCLEGVESYDNMIIDELLLRKSCRPPYLKNHGNIKDHKIYPKCDTKDKIGNAKLETGTRQKMDVAKACYRASEIITEIKPNLKSTRDKNRRYPVWSLLIRYPEEVKVITQSKEVDVHSLIGNIGGYLGLFLGKFLYSGVFKFLFIRSYVVGYNLPITHLLTLGYALVQIPELIYAIVDSIDNRFQREKQLNRGLKK